MKIVQLLKKEYWFFKNLFSHVSAKRFPESWDFQDYDQYWEQRINKNQTDISYQNYLSILSNIITVNDKVLDIGCGTGELLKYFQGKISDKSLGIDISEVAIDYAKRNGINAEIFNVFEEDLRSLGSFDFITCFEVIEHIQNSEYLLLLLSKAFPDSHLIFSIPNTGFIFSRLRLVFGKFPLQWVIHPAEHIRFWTKKDMDSTLERLGFNIISFIPGTINSMFTKILPGLFAESLVYHITPKKVKKCQ
jgi:2-polyprenyl-3-methyl-5-hydroxy-6-metoxy-1,4-benzoquinol methylase